MILTNATIWPMDGGIIENGYVQTKAGKIHALGTMDQCPLAGEGEEVLDLRGKKLLPGFVDAHSHLGLAETGLGLEGDDINEDTDPDTPHLRTLDGINPFDPGFAEARAGGVTCTVVSPGSSNPIAGQICALKTWGRWVDRMVVAEPLAIKFALGENPKMSYAPKPQTPVTRMGTAAIIREQLYKAARYLEDRQRAKEEDLDPPEYDAKCEALLPLLEGEIAAHFHAHKAYDILSAIRIAEEFELDYTIIHCTEGHLIADILAEEKAKVVCGPLICARTKPELMGQSVENCRSLRDAGVLFAISTDHPEVPVEYLLMSASVARANGLSLQEALYAITLGAARAVGLDKRVGSITPGKDADLLVFDRELLEVGTKPEMVIIDGKWIK